MADLPWFPFYVDRFLSSRRTRTMTAEQIGIYLLLLCEQWDKGAVLKDLTEIEDIARASRSQAEAVLRRCFTLTEHGWQNDALEEIRAEQEEKSLRLSEAGRRGGIKSSHIRRSKPGSSQVKPGLKRSQAQASRSQAQALEERREEEIIDKLPPPDSGGPDPSVALTPVGWHSTNAGAWTGANVVGAYVEYCRAKGLPEPPAAERGKQGAAGKRLAAHHAPADIVQAMVGIGTLFPHCPPRNEPWDLFDLERKFTKAHAAMMNDPKLQEAAFDEAFLWRAL